MKLKLIYKFILVMVLIGVLPLTVVGIKMISINRIALQESTRHNHLTTARFLAKSIDDFILALREKLLFLISSQSIQMLDFKGKQAIIQSLLSSTEYFITVSMINFEGEEFIKTYHPDYSEEVQIKNLSGSPLFQQAKKGPAISKVYKEKLEPRMDIIYPMGREYIFITVTLKKLWKDIKSVNIGKEAISFLVDSNGKILAHPRMEMEGKKSNIPPVEAVLTRAGLGSIEYEVNGNKMVGAYAPVENMGWGIVTQQPYNFAYASAIKMKKNAYRWISISIVLSVIISYFLARGLSHPIMKLIKGAKAVAEGDFNHEVRIRTRDELQVLSGTFNNMVKSLKRYNEMQIDKIISEQTKTKAIIFSIADGIVLTDFEGKIMLINNRAKVLLEMDEEPREGADIFSYIKKNEKIISIFKSIKETEIDLSSKGKRKIIKAITDEVKTAAGKKLGKMKIIRDITLEKEIEEMKVRFMHSITHDLKNPLAAIIGMSDLLKRLRGPNIKETEKKYYKILRDEADRLMGMIDDILNLAKLEAGKMELNKEEFDFSEMMEKTLEIFSFQAQQAIIEIKTDLPSQRIKIKADSKLIKRVFINLLGNALKYTPKHGTITMAAQIKAGVVEAAVIDTGEGMPHEMCEIIFDRFQQIKGQSRGGTGIGLNVSKEIVEAHGGNIWAESEIGKGSKFKFTIPV